MERDREGEYIAVSRVQTDASLGAERASTDSAIDQAMHNAQRIHDDLIDRDRILADERLQKFRDRADSLRATQRSPLPPQESALTKEREAADRRTKAERENTDTLVDRERHRADDVVEAERHAYEIHGSHLQSRRQETDDQLTVERSDVDMAVRALGQTRSALAHAQGGRSRSGDVLAMVTHDLRSPLSVISMNAESLVGVTKDVAVLEVADEVIRAAARMERLLTDLLDVARIESGTLQIRKAPHEAGAFIAGVCSSYRPLFENRRLTFSVDGLSDPVTLSFDHDRIVQVLSNLFGNALKFTPPGGTVSLCLERHDAEIEFVLRDSGPGIHPDALPHVFKRFWQVDNNRRGLGLGLHICQKIIEVHGGRIWVESEFGKGATVRFTLPTG